MANGMQFQNTLNAAPGLLSGPNPFSIGALAVGVGADIFNAFRDTTPDFDIEGIQRSIEEQINRQESSALAQIAGDVRARLGSQGLGGSGVINKAILDEQARAREMFSARRTDAMAKLEKFKLGIDIQSQQEQYQRQSQFFSGLGNLGFNIFALKNPQLFKPFQQNIQPNQANENLFQFDPDTAQANLGTGVQT